MKLRATKGATRTSQGSVRPQVLDDPMKGDTGMSAYQMAQANGFSGSMAEWMESLEGPAGRGWTPVLSGEADGVRSLLKVSDWTGGAGEKPALGYIGTAGLVAAKADAFNFNRAKRTMVRSGVTNAQGLATISYSDLQMTNPPAVVALPATTALLSGPTRSTVQGSPTKDSCQVLVQQQGILTGLVAVLVGATANVLLIEA